MHGTLLQQAKEHTAIESDRASTNNMITQCECIVCGVVCRIVCCHRTISKTMSMFGIQAGDRELTKLWYIVRAR